jgi:hypothetical protein
LGRQRRLRGGGLRSEACGAGYIHAFSTAKLTLQTREARVVHPALSVLRV